MYSLLMHGDELISCSYRTIKVWDCSADWACVQTLRDHTMPVVALVRCGDKFVSGSKDNTAKVWSKNDEGAWALYR